MSFSPQSAKRSKAVYAKGVLWMPHSFLIKTPGRETVNLSAVRQAESGSGLNGLPSGAELARIRSIRSRNPLTARPTTKQNGFYEQALVDNRRLVREQRRYPGNDVGDTLAWSIG
jgi:hypothetical protein